MECLKKTAISSSPTRMVNTKRIGVVAEGDAADDSIVTIVTPYFKHKILCEEYTRKLCDANEIRYCYESNIWASYGKWKHANGDEIDESQVPVGERFEKR